MLSIGRERFLDRCRRNAAPPIARQERDAQSQALRHSFPERREVACLRHEHAVSRRERICERRFPGTGSRCRIDHDIGFRAKNSFHSCEDGPRQRGEFRPAVIDGRLIDSAQHAIGYVGRTRNLQEVPTGRMAVEGDHGGERTRLTKN